MKKDLNRGYKVYLRNCGRCGKIIKIEQEKRPSGKRICNRCKNNE